MIMPIEKLLPDQYLIIKAPRLVDYASDHTRHLQLVGICHECCQRTLIDLCCIYDVMRSVTVPDVHRRKWITICDKCMADYQMPKPTMVFIVPGPAQHTLLAVVKPSTAGQKVSP